MLDELAKESEQMIGLAYLYAKTFQGYGEDITKAWDTAIQQASIVEKAYLNGYADAQKRILRGKDNEQKSF